MYKYLRITSNLDEMMVMLKSLPTNTVIVDKKGKIVDINQPALNFLSVRALDDFKIKRWGVVNESNYLLNTICELNTGRVIREKTYSLKIPDGGFVNVKFSAGMLNGSRSLFIFQFTEISMIDYHASECYWPANNQLSQDQYIVDRHKSDRVKRKLLLSQELRESIFHTYLDKESIKLLANKYPDLSELEAIICGLFLLNLTIVEISAITCKSPNSIRGMLRQLLYRFEVNSRKKLYLKLIEDCPIVKK